MLTLGVWYVNVLAVLFFFVCIFMILVILIQRPRGGGLAGAFGGVGGGSQAVFGAKTGDVLTWFTVVCFAAFLLLAMGLTWTIQYDHSSSAPMLEAAPPADTTTPQQEPADPATQEPTGGDPTPSGSDPGSMAPPQDENPDTEPGSPGVELAPGDDPAAAQDDALDNPETPNP